MQAARLFSLSLVAALVVGCQSNADDQLSTESSQTAAYAEGVPGGVVTETDELQASVTAIDPAKRSFTLKDDEGNSRTFQAPPQMHNFDQLKVGDRVHAVVGLERIVYLRQPGEASSDGGAGVLATAPLGSKPGMLVADTVEISAVVRAMDTKLRTATLRFPDGSERTVKVRPDVDMKTEYLGREVVLRLTSAFAVRVDPQ
ncbi:hypothetical protein A9179_08640 [Pseudomonas alcaligenes]|uniref:DUF5666 domain-containing protein n=1 Tax=Aquipseudomonas alcaligenes TaxID=43263 RepID=A0ABR7S187_AQUAC|nr:hypothetical protein [Pseudomonas alcaligenes]MBC9250336.1 hypothetical protein [Pseudomonas alcaligenes]